MACLQAARRALGPDAVVLRCGHLTGGRSLETVAALRVSGLKDDKAGVPIAKLKILREAGDSWGSLLEIDGEITNGAGYVGVDYIDDARPFPYYRLQFTDAGATWGSRTTPQVALVLSYMTREGRIEPEDLGIGIGWNPVTGRFQELAPNGEDFEPEIKSPRHINTR